MENERLLKLKQVQKYVPFCRSKIYQLLDKNEFPKPLKIGEVTS
jgi:predicted DNA-binding transcriptional regulator AlpA